ncbi:hypothetical protein [Absidia glauca]|uniref:Claudin n=1 Tax=Absidia glauca TaxID=4829 RepID=A0A163JWW5_ABSGL|nr:hypothetical protein [Absidia glauca]
MGSSLYHMLGLLFSAAGLVLMIFVNIGTTFTSSFLPNIYLAEASFGTISIRFGPYNACIMNSGNTTCTKPTPAQGLDYSAYGIDGLSGVDTDALAKLSTAYKFIVLVIPATVLALISMFGWLMIRDNRSGNRLPIIGAISSIIGAICGAAALALVIVCYRLAFQALQTKIPIAYQWGPSLYLLGVGGCGCLLVSFLLYVIVCVRHKKDYDYTYFQKDEYATTHGDNRHYY